MKNLFHKHLIFFIHASSATKHWIQILQTEYHIHQILCWLKYVFLIDKIQNLDHNFCEGNFGERMPWDISTLPQYLDKSQESCNAPNILRICTWLHWSGGLQHIHNIQGISDIRRRRGLCTVQHSSKSLTHFMFLLWNGDISLLTLVAESVLSAKWLSG